jgi:hypothetical protein
VQLSERNAEAEKALYKVSELSAKVEEQKELIARLEEDIQKVSFSMHLHQGLSELFLVEI